MCEQLVASFVLRVPALRGLNSWGENTNVIINTEHSKCTLNGCCVVDMVLVHLTCFRALPVEKRLEELGTSHFLREERVQISKEIVFVGVTNKHTHKKAKISPKSGNKYFVF